MKFFVGFTVSNKKTGMYVLFNLQPLDLYVKDKVLYCNFKRIFALRCEIVVGFINYRGSDLQPSDLYVMYSTVLSF